MSNLSEGNFNTQLQISESTPRYGPLPSLGRAPTTVIGSAPMHRRVRVPPPPPAYSDLDDFDTDRPASECEPRYQPMPLHSISRRPLPSQPIIVGSRGSFRNENGKQRPSQDKANRNKSKSPSSSNGSCEGDYEDISQL